MYTNYFGLNEKPFNITPDPRFLYLSENHKEALAHLIYAVRERRGFIVLTGDVGTGKTILLNTLLSQLNENVKRAYIVNPNFDIKGFYHFLAKAFSLSVDGNETDFLLKFSNFLKGCHEAGNNVLLIIDEAQNLKPELLEEIRLLSNMETPQSKMIQIFLVGQEELNMKLDLDSLRQLRQRISVRYHMTPLNYDEAKKYIQHRLNVAGANGKEIFSAKSIKKIYQYSSGIPRIINILCDNSLVIAYARERKLIDISIVKETAGDLNLSLKTKKSKKKNSNQQNIQTKTIRQGTRLSFALPSLAILSCLCVILYFGKFGENEFLKKRFNYSSALASLGVNLKAEPTIHYPAIDHNMSQTLLSIPNKKDDDIAQSQKKTEDLHEGTDQDIAKELFVSESDKEESHISQSQINPSYPTKEAYRDTSKKVNYQYLIAKPGDSLSLMALGKYGIVNREILELLGDCNPEIKDLNLINIGQVIKFPILEASHPAIIASEDLYGVHVASFLHFKDAIAEHRKWLDLGYEAQLIPVMIPGKGKWYRIILGTFSSMSESKAFADNLLLLKKSIYAEAIPINFLQTTKIETSSNEY